MSSTSQERNDDSLDVIVGNRHRSARINYLYPLWFFRGYLQIGFADPTVKIGGLNIQTITVVFSCRAPRRTIYRLLHRNIEKQSQIRHQSVGSELNNIRNQLRSKSASGSLI